MKTFTLRGTRKRSCLTSRNKKRRGITSVEFALIAPVFFLFLIGTTELSLIMLVEHLLENAAYNASRTAKTGYIEQGQTQMETVMAEINKRIGNLDPLIDPDNLVITSTTYGDLSDIGQPDEGLESLGTAGEVVVYTISYPWKFFTPLIGDLMGDSERIITLSSRIVVRNEPYN